MLTVAVELRGEVEYLSDLYLQTAADQKTDYYLGTYALLGVGAVITIMGFLGCCGAWKESPWMLGTVSFKSAVDFVYFYIQYLHSVLRFPSDCPVRRDCCWDHGVFPGK